MQNGDFKASVVEMVGRVVALGRKGMGRAEIAAALEVGLDELGAMEARSVRLAAAMRRAADAERAWWEAVPREALAAGARFDAGAWREAMRWRFGADEAEAGGGATRGKAAGRASEPERPRTIYLIPDNGMELGPGGGPMTPDERRARTLGPLKERIEELEQRLAELRERLAEADSWDYGDEDEDGDGDPDDWGEDDWEGDDDGENARDEDGGEDAEMDDDDGGDADGDRCDGGDADGGARGGGGRDVGRGDERLSAGAAGWPLSGGAGLGDANLW